MEYLVKLKKIGGIRKQKKSERKMGKDLYLYSLNFERMFNLVPGHSVVPLPMLQSYWNGSVIFSCCGG